MTGLTVTVALLLGSNVFASVPLVEDAEIPTPVSRDWRGGPISLPIGLEYSAPEILSTSLSLPQTADLVQSFVARGYIRRVDQDQASSTDSMSCAFLAWQKPGVSTRTESPVIRILSKKYFSAEEGKQVVETQAFAGVLRDSSGFLATYLSGPDAPILMGEVVPADTPGAIVLDQGKLAQTSAAPVYYRVTARETMSRAKTLCKDAWKASCPWVRTISHYGIIVGAAGAGASSALTGNVPAAMGIALGAELGRQWIDNKWTCPGGR